MIFTKQQQEKIVENYVKEKHNTDEVIGFIDGINETINLINRLSIPFEIIKTKENCCANCKGINTGGFAWIYCEERKNNDEQFDGDCGETLGCNRFISALANER